MLGSIQRSESENSGFFVLRSLFCVSRSAPVTGVRDHFGTEFGVSVGRFDRGFHGFPRMGNGGMRMRRMEPDILGRNSAFPIGTGRGLPSSCPTNFPAIFRKGGRKIFGQENRKLGEGSG